MRLLGIGLHGTKKFCTLTELPRPISHSCYNTTVQSISLATADMREQFKKKTAVEEQGIATEKEKRKKRIGGLRISGNKSWPKKVFHLFLE